MFGQIQLCFTSAIWCTSTYLRKKKAKQIDFIHLKVLVSVSEFVVKSHSESSQTLQLEPFHRLQYFSQRVSCPVMVDTQIHYNFTNNTVFVSYWDNRGIHYIGIEKEFNNAFMHSYEFNLCIHMNFLCISENVFNFCI